MKLRSSVALILALGVTSIANAQIVEPGTEYTVRVGHLPNLILQVGDDQAHSHTNNVVSGVEGPQAIGFVFEPLFGTGVRVDATETFTVDAMGNFVFTLSVESALRFNPDEDEPGDPGFGDLSQSIRDLTDRGTGIFIGQNLDAAFGVDPDFGGATPPVPFTPSNAVILPHEVDSVVVEVFDLNDGTLRGSDEVSGVGAFNDAANDFMQWEGFVGVGVTEGEDNIPAGTIPGFDIGMVRLTITGTVEAPDFILGDTNGDGVVDLLDVASFVDLILNGGFLPAADFNEDGVVDLLDVAPFVALLLG